MAEMLRNNPPDVVYEAFSVAFFKGAIRMFQKGLPGFGGNPCGYALPK